jgi:hypothetical protein
MAIKDIYNRLDYLYNMQMKRCCPVVQKRISDEIDKLIKMLI